MKRKTLICILILEAVLLSVLAVLTILIPSLFSSLLAFPFEQVALGIKAVSQTGAFGNGIAFAILTGISLIPLFFALLYRQNKAARAERFALVALSAVLFCGLYGMINPGVFRSGIPGGSDTFIRMIRAVFGITIWTVVILYVVLRLIRLFREGNREQLMRYLRLLLCVLCIYFVSQCAVAVVAFFQKPEGSFSGSADICYTILRLVTAIVPVLFDISVCLHMINVLEIAETNEQDGLAEAASRLSRISCLAVTVTAGLSALQHLVQLFLLPYLSDINAAAEIPLISIFFVVVILLFSRLLIENKQLREDNSLII